MEDQRNNPEIIDLREIARKIWANKRLFYKVLPITFVLSCLYIVSLPRYYTSEVKLAPELESSMGGGGLSALASSFGFDLSDMQTNDAITPLLYPDLMEDNGFVYSLMDIKVVNQDGDIRATYHDYLKKYQKKAWWAYPIGWLKSLLPKAKDKGGSKGAFDPYNLTKKEDAIFDKVRKNIKLSIDKKTGVITINVTSQDALISKTLGDSIQERLQVFITQYRTNKARTDYEYYKELTAEAKKEYDQVRRKYAHMSDANTHITLLSATQKVEDVANDMQLKFTAYTTLNTQLQTAKAKVQERTPAFTVIKGAAVPVKPAGPKRMLFVIGMMILAFFGTCFHIVKKDLHFSF